MRINIKTRGLSVLVLMLVLLYSGARTFMTMEDNTWRAIDWTQGVEFDPQSALSNLENFFIRLADTVYAYDDSRNPLVRIKADVDRKRQEKGRPRVAQPAPKRKPRPILTGLILDQDPVAIIKLGGEDFTLRRGDFFQGNQVIEIDEEGVHLLADGAVVTIR